MAYDGGNDTLRARVFCPFYHRHTNGRQAIVCEGLASGMETSMVFRKREDMERYSEKYCETYRYNRCPLARGLNLKNDMLDERAGR